MLVFFYFNTKIIGNYRPGLYSYPISLKERLDPICCKYKFKLSLLHKNQEYYATPKRPKVRTSYLNYN